MSAIATAADITAAVGARRRSAWEVVEAALAAIERGNKRLNAFTAVTAERASRTMSRKTSSRQRMCAASTGSRSTIQAPSC